MQYILDRSRRGVLTCSDFGFTASSVNVSLRAVSSSLPPKNSLIRLRLRPPLIHWPETEISHDLDLCRSCRSHSAPRGSMISSVAMTFSFLAGFAPLQENTRYSKRHVFATMPIHGEGSAPTFYIFSRRRERALPCAYPDR